jgi:hypothetical protein
MSSLRNRLQTIGSDPHPEKLDASGIHYDVIDTLDEGDLRTSISIARLSQSQTRHNAAYDWLKPVYDWFT